MRLVLVTLVRLATLVALAACSAESRWQGFAAEDSWTTPPGIPVQLRVSKYGHGVDGTITAVALPASAAESPTGPAVAGTRLPVTLAGVACTVEVLGRTTEDVARSRSTAEEVRRPNSPAGTRTLQFLSIRIECGDQPLPGTDASLRGARSRTSVPWAALIFAIAIGAGVFYQRGITAGVVGLGAVAFVGAVVLAFVLFDDGYRVNYAMLYFGVAMLGLLGMRGDSRALRIAIVAGTVVGAAIAPLIWPLWSMFAPLLALVFALLAAALAAIAVVLKQG